MKILCLQNKAPYQSENSRTLLELTMTGGLFEKNYAIAFIDKGVFQLLKNQNSAAINQHPFTAMYKSLSLYDINDVFVEEESLQRYGLTPDDLLIKTQVLCATEFKKILSHYQQIIQL